MRHRQIEAEAKQAATKQKPPRNVLTDPAPDITPDMLVGILKNERVTGYSRGAVHKGTFYIECEGVHFYPDENFLRVVMYGDEFHDKETRIPLEYLRSIFAAQVAASKPAAASGEAAAYKLQDGERIHYSRLGQSSDGLPFMTDSDQHGVWDIAMVFHAKSKRPEHVFLDSYYATPPSQAPALQWAVARWNDEVANRPLVNVHRRSLDDTWRQVIRYFEGDPDALIGPSHDALLALNPITPPTPATVLPAKEVAGLTDEQIDLVWREQLEEYGQVCDKEDFRMFARTIRALK